MPTKVVPIHKGIVKNGVLKLIARDKFNTWLQCLSGEVELTVKPPIKHRSSPENRYYWSVIIQMISDETGASPEDVHQEMKRMFLRVGGEKIPITKSTTELSTTEFEDYVSKIRMWAASFLNLTIPLPNEIL